MTHIAANSSAPRRVSSVRLESDGQLLDLPVSLSHDHSSGLLAGLAQPAVARDDPVAALLGPEDDDFVVGRLGIVGRGDRLPAVERPDRNTLEWKSALSTQPP